MTSNFHRPQRTCYVSTSSTCHSRRPITQWSAIVYGVCHQCPIVMRETRRQDCLQSLQLPHWEAGYVRFGHRMDPICLPTFAPSPPSSPTFINSKTCRPRCGIVSFLFLTVSFMNKVTFNYNLVRSNSFLLFLFWGEPSLWIFDAHTAGHDEKVQQKTDAIKRHTPCSIPV